LFDERGRIELTRARPARDSPWPRKFCALCHRIIGKSRLASAGTLLASASRCSTQTVQQRVSVLYLISQPQHSETI